MKLFKKLPKISKKTIVIASTLVLIVGIPAAYYLWASRQEDTRAWYDSNWAYRRAVQVSNPGSTLTNEDVLISVDTSTLVTAGKLQSDCDDLRFLDSDDTTTLSYWIEDGCNTTDTKVWIRVPSVPNGTKTIYMYYGNPTVSSASLSWSGVVTLFADASCPAGWTRNTEMDGKFLFGSDTYGTTGGSSSHSHTASGETSSSNVTSLVAQSGFAIGALGTHTHSYTINFTTSDAIPAYTDTVMCYNNHFTIPSGLISIFNSTAPTGWTRFSALDDRFPRGGATYGVIGGTSSQHNHQTPSETVTTSASSAGSAVSSFSTSTGADGAVTISSATNINTTNRISGRSCSQGGDAVNYSVTALSANTATVTPSVAAGCLAAGDKILLINLQGTSSYYSNVGNYEILQVQSVSGSTVTFTTNKTKYYGNGSNDTNIGTATSNQRVMLQRVPQYTNLTVNSTFYPSSWNGVKGGVLAFEASGTVTVGASGSIHANASGYRGGAGNWFDARAQGGESYGGYAGSGGYATTSAAYAGVTGFGGGGGGGYTNGATNGASGQTGSGGGAGGGTYSGTHWRARSGGGGGGGNGGVGLGGQTLTTNWAGNGSGTTGGTGDASLSSSSAYGGGGGGGGTSGNSASLPKLTFGGGGGAGGGAAVRTEACAIGGNGGAGGGIVLIGANTLSVSGSIKANGSNGIGDSCGGALGKNPGGGGGGAGGSVKLIVGSATLGSSLVQADNGVGAVPEPTEPNYGVGGAGGNGLVAVQYISSISGSTLPSSNNTKITTTSVAQHPHTHSILSSWDTYFSSNLPPYRKVIFGKNDSSKYVTEANILITNELPPLGWNRVTDLDNRFARGGDTYGETGGAETHKHGFDMTLPVNSDSVPALGSGTSFASAPHAHTIIAETNSVSNMPPYISVIYTQRKVSLVTSLEVEETYNKDPNAPSNLLAEGVASPQQVTDTTPEFSAVFSDPDTGDTGVYYEIEVNTASDFTGAVMWDSGKTAITPVANGARSSDISYAGNTLSLDGSTYYWRMKFWDSIDSESSWSTTASFIMSGAPNQPSFIMSGAPNQPSDLTVDGQVNPTTLDSLTPTFSAVHTDPNSDDAVYYEIEVNSNSLFSGTVKWDSGKQSVTAIPDGERSTEIAYDGTPLTGGGTTYYWRIRFWDTDDNVSDWSATAQFRDSIAKIRLEGLELEGIKIN